MAGTTADDDAAATVPMIGSDECTAAPPTDRPRRWDLESEPPAEVRAAARRAGRLQFRRYCVSCGRSTEGALKTIRLAALAAAAQCWWNRSLIEPRRERR